MGRKYKAVVESGAQVTEINKDCMVGKQSRQVILKGVAEDNSLMAGVVDDVEIEIRHALYILNRIWNCCRAGREHGNADGMSWLPDMRKKFEEEVDNVVPLVAWEISLEPGSCMKN